MPALAVEDRFRAGLEACRARDAESGGAAEGPHRSDLIVRHVAKDMPAAQCSTGEQKALLIAIVLANARLALFDAISALGAQVWLTGTERALFAGLEGRAQFFAVRDGTVSVSADARTS
jgi:DNA replication and repair protein RecF